MIPAWVVSGTRVRSLRRVGIAVNTGGLGTVSRVDSITVDVLWDRYPTPVGYEWLNLAMFVAPLDAVERVAELADG